MVLSPAAEDYLKTIYKLRTQMDGAGDAGAVTTQALADRLDVAASSATAMVKKLATLKLVRHEKYRGVELTEAGEKIALEVIRHHRLIETFLAEVLGMEWDQVHAEAEKWEHVLSEEVEAKISAALNHPTHDPHGSPIPAPDGSLAPNDWTPLARAAQEQQVSRLRVRRVSDNNPAVLRHLREVGLVPHAQVEVLEARPEAGVLHLRIDGEERIVGATPASAVWVSPETE
jgi:DtxR family Mn-dependent transcriptional regulator